MLITLVSIFNFAKARKFTIKANMQKEPILIRFGKNVQDQRKAKQLSQEQLASLAGVHRTYIGMIERAEKNITLCNIQKIAKALNVNITQLLEE